MSGAHITGSMPQPGRILGVLDAHAKLAAIEARNIVTPLIQAEAPGALGDSLSARVSRTATGYRTTVQAPRKKRYKDGEATVAQVVRWVNRGTGLYRVGPGPKRPITGKRGVLGRMTLPGGRRVRSVRGQRPNPFVARAEDRARIPVERALRTGAKKAAGALRRL